MSKSCSIFCSTSGKRKPRFDQNRWEFKKAICPYCSKLVCKNWLERHIREKHKKST